MNFGKQLKEGLITQNPVLVQVLGMCSTMAITTSSVRSSASVNSLPSGTTALMATRVFSASMAAILSLVTPLTRPSSRATTREMMVSVPATFRINLPEIFILQPPPSCLS